MSKKAKPGFTPENLHRACMRKFGFCVVAYEPAKTTPGAYGKGQPVMALWGVWGEYCHVSLGAAKRSEWDAMLEMIDKKWPNVIPASHASRALPKSIRFFKAGFAAVEGQVKP